MRDLRRDAENCGYSRTKLQDCGERLFYGVLHASSGITCCKAVCVDIESNRKGNAGFRHTIDLARVLLWLDLKEVSSGLLSSSQMAR
jgi:hypothetical protein